MTRPNKTGKSRRYWTPNEWDRAQRMAEEEASIQEIGIAVDRPPDQVRYKFENERRLGNTTLHPHSEGMNSIAAERLEAAMAKRNAIIRAAMDDRDRRAELRAQQNLTAQFFGDPPPGYSELDKRRAREGVRG